MTTTTTTTTTAIPIPVRINDDRLEEAVIQVSLRDKALAETIATAIKGALSSVPTPPPLPRIIRLRTRKKLDALAQDPSTIAGAVVNVRVTDRNARRLPDLVDAIRAMKPLGVQLIWDGVTPEREHVEQHVFVVLERSRATPAAAPVVLVKSCEPGDDEQRASLPLRFLIASRAAAATAAASATAGNGHQHHETKGRRTSCPS